jgi:hypothetical protein
MNTDKQWEKWGGANPYYGVLSDDKFRGKELSGDVFEDFFKSGQECIDAFEGLVQSFPNNDGFNNADRHLKRISL